jgi:hypothetical protein
MGLDLIPMGRAKPGHEQEWQKHMEALYRGEQASEEEAQLLMRPYRLMRK